MMPGWYSFRKYTVCVAESGGRLEVLFVDMGLDLRKQFTKQYFSWCLEYENFKKERLCSRDLGHSLHWILSHPAADPPVIFQTFKGTQPAILVSSDFQDIFVLKLGALWYILPGDEHFFHRLFNEKKTFAGSQHFYEGVSWSNLFTYYVILTHICVWPGVRCCVQCGCTVLAKLWRLVGCTKIVSR